MVATSPVAAIKGSRTKVLIFSGGTVASGATVYVCGSATASTGPILGVTGKVAKVQITGLSGTTGDTTARVYIIQGTDTPGTTNLAMSAVMTDTARSASSETVGTATNGAAIAATDRLVVNILGGTLGASITVPFVTVSIETDD